MSQLTTLYGVPFLAWRLKMGVLYLGIIVLYCTSSGFGIGHGFQPLLED